MEKLEAGQIKINPFRRWQKKAAPYIFISPFYIAFLIFGAFPIVFALYLSFNTWTGVAGTAIEFVGWENYYYTLTDPMFWDALKTTILIGVYSGVPQHILALFFAFILNLGFVKVKEFWKATIFMPYITSAVAIALVFSVFYSHPNGFLNYIFVLLNNIPGLSSLLSWIGLDPPVNWLANTAWMRPAVSFTVVWMFTGWNTILYLAGMQAISHELYEAARVDGARSPQIFFRITLPCLKRMIQFAVIMTVIGQMQLFDQPLILFGVHGGTGRAGYTIAMFLYQTAFNWNFFGSAASIAYVTFMFILVITLITKRLLRSHEEVD